MPFFDFLIDFCNNLCYNRKICPIRLVLENISDIIDDMTKKRRLISPRAIIKQSLWLMRTRLKFALMTIFGLGLIFGLLVAANLWLHGLGDTYAQIAGRSTNGKVLLIATTGIEREANPDEAEVLMNREEMIHDLEQNGGEIIGDAQFYGQYGSIVIPTDLLSRKITQIDYSNIPENAQPVLVSPFLGEQFLDVDFPSKYSHLADKVASYETYRTELLGQTFADRFGTEYYIAGFAPSNFQTDNLSFNALEKSNTNPLNPLLRLIRFPDTPPIVLDKESGKERTLDYAKGLEGSVENLDNPQSQDNIDEPAVNKSSYGGVDSLLVSFKDPAAAYYYFRHGHGIFPNFDAAGREYYIDVVAGMSPEITYLVRGLENIVGIIAIVLLVIILIVLTLGLRNTLKQDSKTLAKYRKQDASRGQIRASYVCYYSVCMILTALLAFGLGSLVVVIFNMANQDLLSTQYLLGFSLDEAPKVAYYSFGVRTLILLILIPTTGAVAAWLGTRKIKNNG